MQKIALDKGKHRDARVKQIADSQITQKVEEAPSQRNRGMKRGDKIEPKPVPIFSGDRTSEAKLEVSEFYDKLCHNALQRAKPRVRCFKANTIRCPNPDRAGLRQSKDASIMYVVSCTTRVSKSHVIKYTEY